MNHHGTALVLGDRGLLVTGAAGAGKSTLALLLIDRARAGGRHAVLVADDQVLLAASGGRLVARPPATIAGLAEHFGAGPLPVPHRDAAVIDAMVELTTAAPRLDTGTAVLCGVAVPRLRLAAGAALPSALTIEAWLAGLPR